VYEKLKEEKFSGRVLPVNMPRSRVRALARASYRALARDTYSSILPGTFLTDDLESNQHSKLWIRFMEPYDELIKV
jgi:hypothetical protein